MRKKISKKCTGTILISILLATVGTVKVGAHITNFRNDKNMKWKQEIPSQLIEGQKNEGSNLTFKYNELSGDILNIQKELKEQGSSQEEMRAKLQCILQDSSILAKAEEQSSKTLRDFYGIGIFSCRGFV